MLYGCGLRGSRRRNDRYAIDKNTRCLGGAYAHNARAKGPHTTKAPGNSPLDLNGSLRTRGAAGFAAVSIGVAALPGLWAGLPMLSSWGSGIAILRPVRASGLTSLGLALIYPGTDARVAFRAAAFYRW